MESYGKTQADKYAEENKLARQIVSEIGKFGVSDRQRWLIMYYLSLEIEDAEKMQEVASFLKEMNPSINMTQIYEGSKNG
jgi:hypothetical protein